MKKVAIVMLVLIPLLCPSVSASEYNHDISVSISPNSFYSNILELEGREYVRISLEANSAVDVYFVDQENFNKLSRNEEFDFYAPLSALNVISLDRTEQVMDAGKWYLVVTNEDWSDSVILMGHITVSENPIVAKTGIPMQIFVIIAVLVLIILSMIVIFWFILKRNKKQPPQYYYQPPIQQPPQQYPPPPSPPDY